MDETKQIPLALPMSILKRFAVFATGAVVLTLLPTLSHAADPKKVEISATDQMKYDVTDITVKVGQPLTITLTNNGSLPKVAMAHDLVVLRPGTDPAAYVTAASKAAAENYLPADESSKVLRATKLLGPGESDTITFTPKAAGTYDYVCTFPAHYLAGMHGTITVE